MQVVVDDLVVNYSTSGQGDVALFLHGWGADKSNLQGLSKGLIGTKNVLLDLPGFGGSQPPLSAWAVEDYSRFVTRFLDKLGIKDVSIILGHSFGGRIALELAASGLLKPRKLILLASHGLPEPLSSGQKIVSIMARASKILPSALRRPLVARLASADYKAAQGVMKPTFIRVIAQDVTASAPNITCPTLLIYGNEDTTTPPDMGRRLSRLIPKAKLSIINEAGHYVHMDRPDEVVAEIRQFI